MAEQRIREPRPRRADAVRNVETIISAALRVLEERPNASMAEIARASGLVRTTVYAHFASREALVDAIIERAVVEVNQAESEALLDEGPAADALDRLVDAAWRVAQRYLGATDAILRVLGDQEFRERRTSFEASVRAVIERGRAEGVFRTDLPVEWCVEVVDNLFFAAHHALRRGAIDKASAPGLLKATLGAALRVPSHSA